MPASVRFNSSGLRRLERLLPAAAARAINRSATAGRVIAQRAIATENGLKVRLARSVLTLTRATGAKPEAVLTLRDRRIPLIEFSARGPEPSRGRRGTGVTSTFRGQRVVNRRAFIATMRSGHRGVFHRIGRTRLPIRELSGPSLIPAFEQARPGIMARYDAQLQTNLRHEVTRVLQRAALR